MDIKGAKMLTGDFTPEARPSQHLKDVRLILTTAKESGAQVAAVGAKLSACWTNWSAKDSEDWTIAP